MKGTLYAVIASYLAVLVVGLVCIGYANHVAHESEQRWCGVVATLDDAYAGSGTGTRPQTAIGLQLMNEVHKLRAEFGC